MKRHLVKFAQVFGITVLAVIALFIIATIGHLIGVVNPIARVLYYCAVFAGGWVIGNYIVEK